MSAGHIRNEYGLSHGEFGAVYMLATLGSALTLPHLGRIVDRRNERHVVMIVIPALALASVAMSVSHHITTLVLAIFALRLFGQGMMVHTAMTAMGRWFRAERGRAVALANLGLQAGEATFPSLFVVVLVHVGWRDTWLIAALTLIAFALPLIAWLVRRPRTPRAREAPARHFSVRDWTRSEVIHDSVFWLSLAGIMAPSFIGTTVFFHQVYLVELRGWQAMTFAHAFTVMAITTVVFAIATGVLVDRFSATRLLPGLLLPLVAACFALAQLEAEWGAYLSMGLVGVSYGVSSTLFGALWPEVYGLKHLGAVRAVIVSALVLATALGPGITGALIDLGISLPTQLGAMGLYCLFASAVLLVVSRRIVARNAASAEA